MQWSWYRSTCSYIHTGTTVYLRSWKNIKFPHLRSEWNFPIPTSKRSLFLLVSQTHTHMLHHNRMSSVSRARWRRQQRQQRRSFSFCKNSNKQFHGFNLSIWCFELREMKKLRTKQKHKRSVFHQTDTGLDCSRQRSIGSFHFDVAAAAVAVFNYSNV